MFGVKTQEDFDNLKKLMGKPEEEQSSFIDFAMRNKGKIVKVKGNKIMVEPEKQEKKKQCEHNNWHIPSDAPIGKGQCRGCGEYVWISDLFEDMRKRLQALIDEAK